MNAIRLAATGLSKLRIGFWCVVWALVALPGAASAATEDAWNASSCSGCHSNPITVGLPEGNIFLNLSERFSTLWCSPTHAGNGLAMCTANGSYFTAPGGTNLSAVYDFVVDARDSVVTGGAGTNALSAFGATAFGATQTQTVTITNYRDEALAFTASVTTNPTDFDVVNSTCTLVGTGPLRVSVPAATAPGPAFDLVPTSCNITARFHPAASTVAARSGSLRLDFTGYSVAQPAQRNLPLSGTAQFPVYSPSGFAALTSPGFSAPTDSAQTVCRTITNSSATTASLSLSFATTQATGAIANYANYYELDNLCAGFTAPLCLPPGPSLSGTTAPNVAAGQSCTLAIKFNPGKFGFVGGTGARSAKLTVTHNYPTPGQTVEYTLVGNATTGPEPQIGISTNPGAVGGQVLPPAFSSQVVGTPSAAWNEFLVSNSGTADNLDITQVLNSNPAEFALTENCVSAPPLARLVGSTPTCTIGLTFTPLAGAAGLGQRCTTITVRAAFSGNGDQAVTVCGSGIPVPVPQMDVSRTAIAFGNRAIGAVYLPEPLVITNRASATLGLQIGAVSIGGAGFAFVPDASSCAGQTLAAGASCTLQVQFTPASNAPDTTYSANLTLASNDPTTPNLVVPLTATARAAAVPVLQWDSTAALTFTDLVIAGQQSTQTYVRRLTNVGPGAVDLAAVRLVGTDASSFSVSGCATTLYDSQFCDVTVRFLPGSGGQKTAQIEVVSATAVVPATLVVTGQGVGGSSPFLRVSSNALTFGGVRVGARSDPLQLRLSAGDGVVTVTGITAAAPFSVASQTCPAVPFSLPAGGECTIVVTFAPSAASDAAATLHIATDTASAIDVSLDGVGQEQANVSGGGCSLADGQSPVDPMLGLLVVLSAAILWRRQTRRARNDHHNQGEPNDE